MSDEPEQLGLGDVPPPAKIEGRPDLRVIDGSTGELCPGCLERDARNAATETEKKGWRVRYQNLKRRVEAELTSREHWPEANEVFNYWRDRTGHTRSVMSEERQSLVAPYIEEYGVDECKRAIDGRLESDWHMKRGADAKRKGPIHDGFEQIFASSETFDKARGAWDHRDQQRILATARLEVAKLNQGLTDRTARRLASVAFLIEAEADPLERAGLIRNAIEIAEEDQATWNTDRARGTA